MWALEGASLDVLIGGAKIGTMRIDDDGRGLLELYSDKGATGVPSTVAGQKVAVMRGASTVVSGQFP